MYTSTVGETHNSPSFPPPPPRRLRGFMVCMVTGWGGGGPQCLWPGTDWD